jgi:hypothetical protein
MNMNPPGFIRLLLWYHCTTTPPEPNGCTREWTDQMFTEGLIIPAEEPGTFTTSEKGMAYVELLCSTPYPVHRWVDPRIMSDVH